MSRNKKILLSVVIFILAFMCSEAVLRLIYFQLRADSSLAWITVFRTAETFAQKERGKKRLQLTNDVPDNVFRALFEAEGGKVLAEVSDKYEKHFASFAEDARQAGTQLLVLYIPSGPFHDPGYRPHQYCRKYFTDLCSKYGVDLCDCTDIMRAYPDEQVFLLPEDGHLSRLGNQLVAEALSGYVIKYKDYHNKITYAQRPTLFGDLLPNNNSMWGTDTKMPHLVVTNS